MTTEHTTDLNDPAAPEGIPAVLRRAAEKMRDAEGELQSAWQDRNAGSSWGTIAIELERCAERIARKL